MAGSAIIMLTRQDHIKIMSYIEHGYEQVSIPGSDIRTFQKRRADEPDNKKNSKD